MGKRRTAEDIVAELRQVDLLSSQGRPIAQNIRAIRVMEGHLLSGAQRVRLTERRPDENLEGACCREHPAPASDLGSLLGQQILQEAANENCKERTPSGPGTEGIGAPSLAEFGPTPVHEAKGSTTASTKHHRSRT